MKKILLLLSLLILLSVCMTISINTNSEDYIVYHFEFFTSGSGCYVYQAYEWDISYDYQDVLDREIDIEDIATPIEDQFCEVCSGLSDSWETCADVPLEEPFIASDYEEEIAESQNLFLERYPQFK